MNSRCFTNVKLTSVTINTKGLQKEEKRKALFRDVTEREYDIILLQETHSTKDNEKIWALQFRNSLAIFNSYSSNRSGTAILIKQGLSVTTHYIDKSIDGRSIIFQGEIEGVKMTLVNLYAPNHEAEQVVFYRDLLERLLNLDSTEYPLMMAGDFNLVFNTQVDKLGGRSESKSRSLAELKQIMNCFSLVDIYRYRNPGKKEYTWSQSTPRVGCRLDFWLVPRNWLPSADTAIKTCVLSDHNYVELVIKSENFIGRGRGLYKLNTAILEENSFCERVKKVIQEVKDMYLDDCLQWEFIKQKVGETARAYSIRRSIESKAKLQELCSNLEKEEQKLLDDFDNHPLDNIKKLRNEIREMQELKAKGAILRTRSNWVAKGEKNNKYFLSLEKSRSAKKTIYEVQKGENIINSANEVQNEISRFYKHLYQKENDYNFEGEEFNGFLEELDVPTLSDHNKNILVGDITEAEVRKTLDNMKKEKSPGSDGLPAEFYLTFWEQIKEPMLKSFRQAYDTGLLAPSQTRGIITLIPKPGKDHKELKNWRPITLLNVDFKLLNGTLANRLKRILSELVGEEQTGFIAGRQMSENIRLVIDLNNYLRAKNKGGYLISVDIEKAYDSLRWEFIDKMLDLYGFPTEFKRWIEIFRNGNTTTVINNGHTVPYFSPSRGVRQGEPISAYLFILSIELLAEHIRKNKSIKGFLSPQGQEIKHSMFADDTMLFLDSHESIKAATRSFNVFGNISGLRINNTKTLAVGLGMYHNVNAVVEGITVKNEPIRILGYWFDHNVKNREKLNFWDKLKKMDKTLSVWFARFLTLKGKILVLKTLGLSQLIFAMLVDVTPKCFLKAVEAVCLKFVWGNKNRAKIKVKVLKQDYIDGGMKFPCVHSMDCSFKAKWVNRIILAGNKKWCSFANAELERFGGAEYLSQCNYSLKVLPTVTSLNPFYIAVLESYSNISGLCDKKNTCIIPSQLILNNQHMLIDKKSICNMKLLKVHRLVDWFSADGILESFPNMRTKLLPYNLQWMSYLQIKSSIPKEWSQDLNRFGAVFKQPRTQLMSHQFRSFLVKKELEIPAGVHKWLQEMISLNINDFNLYFRKNKKVVEAKLQVFQYKILHRILPTQKKRFQWKVAESPLCTACGKEDTLTHALVECPKSVAIWKDLENRLVERESYEIERNNLTRYRLFGSLERQDCKYTLLALLTRYYIYTSRIDNPVQTNTKEWIEILKFKLKLLSLSFPKGLQRDNFKTEFLQWI